MEEEVLEKCIKLVMAYKRLIAKEKTTSTEYVMGKVTEAADTYIDILKQNEFAKAMISRTVYRITELEAERINENGDNSR